MLTFDQYTPDAAGVFLTQQLTKYDWTANDPLVVTTWDRDVPRRLDVAITDDYAAYILNNYAVPGNLSPGGKSWLGRQSTAVAGPAIDVAPIINQLNPWGQMPAWNMRELWQSQFLGRPLDTAKLDVMTQKFEMDTDEQVYIGDVELGLTGLINNTGVSAINTSGSAVWSGKTADQILADFNTLLSTAQTNSGYAAYPTKVLMPYEILNGLTARLVSTAGSDSILTFLSKNNASMKNNGQPVDIVGVKWLLGAGASASNRIVAYTDARKYIQFPRVELQRLAIQNRGFDQILPVMGLLGVVEVRYPETVLYMDHV
jgi:hypothetical protein